MRREYPKVHGWGRRIVVTLFVLGAVGVGADFGSRAIVENRLASSIQGSLGLPERPEIDLGGFPFLLQVARGELEGLSLRLRDVDAEGLLLERVTLSLEGLVFDRVALIRGSGSVAARGGRAEAVVTQDALSTYLQDHGTPVLVKLSGPDIRVSTRISTGSQTTTATAEGPVRVEAGSLVFSPDRVDVEGSVGVPAAALAFDVVLPELVPGIRYHTVLVHSGTAVIQASLDGARLDIGG